MKSFIWFFLKPVLHFSCQEEAEEKRRRKTSNYKFPTPSLSNVVALLIKNWIAMKRSPVVLFIIRYSTMSITRSLQVLLTFVFFLPGIFMILSCTCVGINPSDLPIGVLNMVISFKSSVLAPSILSSLLIVKIQHLKILHQPPPPFQESNCSGVILNNSCEADSLSCYYIDSLNRTKAVHLLDYQVFLLTIGVGS